MVSFLRLGGYTVLISTVLYIISVALRVKKWYAEAGKRKPMENLKDRKTENTRDVFSSKKIPTDLDAIIIGSGIGGMACGGFLAKNGKKVLILEQHYITGGCTHTFDDHGWEFDTGLHYCGDPDVFFPLLNLCMDTPLEWAKMGSPDDGYTFDAISLGSDPASGKITFNCKEDTWKDDLIKEFPEERDGIEAFHRATRDALEAVGPVWLMRLLPTWLTFPFKSCVRSRNMTYSGRSTWDVISTFTTNPKLRALLCAQFGDIGGPPNKASFMLQAGVYRHYQKGGFYPVGGPQEISRKIIPVIERMGGRVLVRAPVDRIITKQGRAIGVEVKGHQISAPIVISGAGAYNTYFKLLERPVVDALPRSDVLLKKLKENGPSAAHFYVFLGIDGGAKELGLRSSNIWVLPTDSQYDCVKMCEDFYADPHSVKDMLLFIGFPSAKDPDFERRFPGKSTCVLLTEAKFEWFEKFKDERQGHRGEEYIAAKKKLTEQMLEGFYKFYPQVRGRVEYTESASPLSNAHYLRAPFGESYGTAPSIERQVDEDLGSLLSAQTPIPGLFLTGQDIVGAGIMPSFLSGLFTSIAVTGVPAAEVFINPRHYWNVATTMAAVAASHVKQHYL